jgi:3-oxoacyl-[acyl-carrier-protein] synthase II
VSVLRDEVVISGWGLCSPFGDDVSRLLQLVEAGEQAGAQARFMPFPEGLGAPGDGVDVLGVAGPEPKDIRNLRRPFPDRLSLLAIEASDDALASAGVDPSEREASRAGVIVHSCYGPSTTVEKYLRALMTAGPSHVSAITFARAVANAVVGELARRYQLRGPSSMIVGGSVLLYAHDLLLDHAADLMLCVGVDILGDNTAWYHKCAGMLDDGMVLGEVGAAVVLERASTVKARGATAKARLLDAATVFCPAAVQRVTDFDSAAIHMAMQEALSRSRISPDRVDLVLSIDNGHAPLRAAERSAIAGFLKDDVLVLAPKRTVGECFGASEILGALLGVEALSEDDDHPHLAIINSGMIGGAVSSAVLEAVAT